MTEISQIITTALENYVHTHVHYTCLLKHVSCVHACMQRYMYGDVRIIRGKVRGVREREWCRKKSKEMTVMSHVTEVDVHDPEHHGDGELDGEDGEEPLGGVHVSLHPLLDKVAVKTLHVLL